MPESTATPVPTAVGAAAGRVVIDPITRIEGHLRVECQVADGVVKDAWVSAGLYRGMEAVLKGRRPEDAFYVAQRICGVCPISHGHASTMSSEEALGIKIPKNAVIIRNLIEAAQYLHSHILWFYTLAALDYVNPVTALSADIADTYALAEQAGTATGDFGAVQKRLKAFVEGGQLSIFAGHWWDHPAYKLSPELNLIAVAHYLEALEMQAEAASIIAVMGGKFPHFMTSVPGGTTWVPTEEKLDDVLFRFTKVKEWIDTRLIPDTLAIAPSYIDAINYGAGTGNLLSWGVFRDAEAPDDPKKRYLARGAVYTDAFKTGKVDMAAAQFVDADPKKVMEYVERSWYESPTKLNPAQGQTTANFTDYKVEDKYSWCKAPRHDGKNMEVGPLARMVVAYLSGRTEVKTIIDGALKALGAGGKPEVLFSLLGRVAARNLEAKVVADWSIMWVNDLVAAIKGGDSSYFVTSDADAGEGAGLWEAPRGSVGHWMTVEGGKIENYQVVAPTTWLCSPRDADGQLGAMEAALVGTPVADAEKPLEPLRVVHSFDP
ncbi:MAG: nickel-dependent hydrogenase large subunit [Coriobacteriaceae bacterium]|nr:nickel-dependent hydrogenase large subunit [Coriobacteriaceae bacterium]